MAIAFSTDRHVAGICVHENVMQRVVSLRVGGGELAA